MKYVILLCFYILVGQFYYQIDSLSPHHAMIYLSKYGYLDLPNLRYLNSPEFESSLVRDGSYKEAIKKFQRFFKLPVTGILTSKMKKLMKSKRCGNQDVNSQSDKFSVKILNKTKVRGLLHRSKRYFIDDPRMRWLKKDLTWKLESYPSSGLSRPQVRAIFTIAFNMWSKEVDLNYREETGYYTNADIVILFGSKEHGDSIPFDGKGAVLAHAFYPSGSNSPAYSRSGDAHFDDDEDWSPLASSRGKNLLAVAVHELGHSMGLGHSGSEKAIMYPFYIAPTGRRLQLDQDDIDGMQKIYGRAQPGKYLPTVPDIPDIMPIYTDPPPTTKAPQKPKINFCNATIDSIIIIREVELYVFSGNLQWRIDFSKTVTSWISYEVRDGPEDFHYYWPILPPSIKHVDGGIERDDQRIYIFSGNRFWVLEDNQGMSPGVPKEGYPLTSLGLPSDLQKIDAIFRWGYNRGLYIMAGTRYWRINEKNEQYGYVYPRYPRRIVSVWNDVPVPVDLAFTGLHGKTYFIKNKQYYQFNNLEMKVEIGPKPFKVAWMGCKEPQNA